MPRAALLSLHARIEGIGSDVLDDPGLVQIWGPRYSAYVVPEGDHAIFTRGRFPESTKAQERAWRMAAALRDHLDGRRATYDAVGDALGINGNALRYGTTTGTVLIRWDGAACPIVWSVPEPEISFDAARLELARRHLRASGPSTPAAFAEWAGVKPAAAQMVFADLADELVPVSTPIGEAWILAADEAGIRDPDPRVPDVRLLPSGDVYYLLQGIERSLLLPDPAQRAQLWTSRVWPGVLLLGGEIRGTWRRAGATFTFVAWGPLSAGERGAVEAEAGSLPLPGLDGPIRVRWE